MISLLRGRLCALLLLLPLLRASHGQETGEECQARFKMGRENFVLDADESVKDGATFISSPKLDKSKDCVSACCKEPRCNVAFMERGAEEGLVTSCFLFDCLYKKKYACRFVRKNGYINYILDSLYDSHLEVEAPREDGDRPPVANGGLDRVVQPQDSVTLNGIESKDDNGIVSYQWQLLTGYPYALIEKSTNFDDQIIVSNLTSGVYKFQLTVTDASGQSDSTKVTVLVLTPEQSEHHCMAPKKVGPCRGSFPRWHYNAASQQCEKFMFGGCRENFNNYLSQDECSIACASSDKSSISGRGLPIPGPQGEKCDHPCTTEEFTCANGCCLVPGLECDATPQCSDGSDELKCDDLSNKFRILQQIPVDEQKLRCTEPPDTGSCRDKITKWYYNPMTRECRRFNYGGCQGNENRFDSEGNCKKICHGVTEKDVFAREGSFGGRLAEGNSGTAVMFLGHFEQGMFNYPNNPSIIAIAALLGVAILVLLGVLLYCLFKGKKKTEHHRVPANSMPVSYEDRDRERLVYNSTTKPI